MGFEMNDGYLRSYDSVKDLPLVERIRTRLPYSGPCERSEYLQLACVEIEQLRGILDRIVKRNPDGTIAIRLTEDALNAAAEYVQPNAKVSGAGTASAGLPGYTAGD